MELNCTTAGHQRLAALETVRVADGLVAAVCPQCRTITWWLEGNTIDAWDGATTSFGHSTILERLPAVGAPGPEVVVCRPPVGTRLAWLPARRWFEAAPQLFVAREGRRLLISSPNPLLSNWAISRANHWSRPMLPVPV